MAEERQQAEQREQLQPDSKHPELDLAADRLHHPAEVLAEEAGEEGERQKDRRNDGELLRDVVQPVRDGRKVGVRRSAQQVAVAVDRVGETDEVVVDVTEATLGL